RYRGDVIPGARFVELEGTDHAYCTQDYDAILDETQRFLTGTSGSGEPERVLATVLFTDIVDSTARAATLGDARWRELLERHDALVREHVQSVDGRVVKTTGDGALACFSGPARAIRCAQDLLGAVRIHAPAHEAPAEPPLEPAADQMTAGDRATVRVARRAPGLLRTISRLTVREPKQG